MDKSQLILFGVATFLAIKSLVALMGQHRQEYKKKLADELTEAAAAASAPEHAANPQAGASTTKPSAAAPKTTAAREAPAKKAG